MKILQTKAQRTAIMAYLEGNKSHPSVNVVYQAVAKQLIGLCPVCKNKPKADAGLKK